MKTSKRFDKAISKLYTAFNSNKLIPDCYKHCAVGSILDNTDSWKHLSDHHGSLKLNYVGNVHQRIGRNFNGYSPIELLKIEATFLEACGYQLPLHYKNEKPKNPTDKNVLFKGLSDVIKLLCEMDCISNVMDYTKLFQLKNDKPTYEIM
ncbi:MAG: Na(+)-translocating NADH-quinone reductase subunit F [Flaviramulus sp.]|nr:Na(+)-translocating NADH-quinone reductase subunit F [Flaviramulus sp.]NNC49757.1 Na(+)-translocating NADH-quinone reductase subunit F [Flaviramulus sp.]